MSNSSILVLSCIFWFLGLIQGVPLSAASYTIQAVQPLAGHNRTQLRGINNRGEVSGRSFLYNEGTEEISSETAIFLSEISEIQPLPSLVETRASVWGLSNGTNASGKAKNAAGYDRAVRWDVATRAVVDLGTLKDPTTQQEGESSTAYDLNDAGQVVGQADIWGSGLTPFHAFYFDEAQGMVDIGTFASGTPQYQNGYSIAYSINNLGQVVGTANDQNWIYRPFVYDRDTGLQQLPIDPSYPTQGWYAGAINDSGMIGGHVITASHQSKPYYWSSKSAAPVAIQMPAEFPYGEIYGINKNGRMVGMMWDNDGVAPIYHAFVFDLQNGVRDLNDLIDQGGWVLNYARDINDYGQIVGAGRLDDSTRGFMLTFNDQEKGDVNSDEAVTLEDAVLTLQLVIGKTTQGQVFAGADADGDGKIGIPEVVFILQTLAGSL